MNAKRKEFELTDSEFEDVLDEIYEAVLVCGIEYSAGRTWREIDPIAFTCAKNEYEDNLSQDSEAWLCGGCGAEFSCREDAEECCGREEET